MPGRYLEAMDISDDSTHDISLAHGDILDTLSSAGLIGLVDHLRSNQPREVFLLKLCDAGRYNLMRYKKLGSKTQEIMSVLGTMLIDASRKVSSVDFALIRNSRFDKLIADILDPDNYLTRSSHEAVAGELQKRWTKRFRADYFDLDQMRFEHLIHAGLLRDIAFNPGAASKDELWQPSKHGVLSEQEGNSQFQPGHWWLNLACAQRDGIVGNTFEIPTKGRYVVGALPLISGTEDVLDQPHTVRYTRETLATKVPVSLISQVGSPIRILRGHLLKSPFAPRAGLRYDGLYMIRQYGQRRDAKTGLHKVTLTLERVPGQPSLDDLFDIPRCSQMDNWLLFERHEGETIKQLLGHSAYLDWKLAKAQDKADHDIWRRVVRATKQLASEKQRFIEDSPKNRN